MLALGGFDRSGSPTIQIRVTGDLGYRDYNAVIDTGFSGFVALPTLEMVPLGLATGGATTVMLGNGMVIDNLVASASVTLGRQTVVGALLLDDISNEALVGMEFLREFRLALIVTNSIVLLYDEGETLEAVLSFMNAAPLGSPDPS